MADTQDRGALDSTDFAIGMYFIQGLMNDTISFIPTSLPPGLHHQAGGGQEPFGPVKSHFSGNSGSFSPVVGSFQQHTGQNHFLQPDITGLFFMVPASSFTHSNGHAPAWDVSPTEKASSDRLFDILDWQKRGYIEGEVAAPFMLGSKLPGEILAQIWYVNYYLESVLTLPGNGKYFRDLADINSDGRLTRDGFAIAIHLIQKKLAGQDVPSKLPPSLMLPSARISALGTFFFSPANAQSHQEHEQATDLFSLDDTPSSSSLPRQPRNNFGAGGDLSALRVEKAEIESAFLRDKEEARELHKRMIETDKQVEALKADVERLKKEAKIQKGLLAIARKQLSTRASEKAKAERERAEADEELSSIARDKDTVDAELAIITSLEPKVAQRNFSSDSSASQPISMTSDLSAVKSSNSIDLTMPSLLLQRSPSPFSIQGSKLPGSDLLAASSTFNSFSAVQTPASLRSSQPSGETMGKMPASVTPSSFSFDSGFEDNFDFASASKTLEIETQDLNTSTQKVKFDDIFNNDDVPTTTGPSTPFYLPPSDKDRTSRTFDSVFASFESSPTVLSRSGEPSVPGSFPKPSSLMPSVRSPQPRSSVSSSSKDNHDKPPEPRARHSKLNVRLI